MDHYFYDIRDFALKPNSSPWKLDRFEVAKGLLYILDNPDNADALSRTLSGEAAFLRAWLYRDPISVIHFATKLFEDGNSSIGGYQVQAADVFLQYDLLGSQKETSPFLNPATWMIYCTLADIDDLPPKYGGKNGTLFSTLRLELKNWLDATKLYSFIETDICLFNETTGTILTSILTGIPGINLSDSQTIDDLIKQLAPYRPTTGSKYTQTDVFLAIHINMFDDLIFQEPYFGSAHVDPAITANLWIMLDEPVEDLGNGQVRLSIWIYEINLKIILTKDAFNKNYYGSIRAHAYGNRRLITPKWFNYMDSFEGTADAWYSQQRTLEVDWTVYNDNIECYAIQDMDDLNKLLGHFWYNGPNNHISMNMPDPVDPHNHKYRVCAYNNWHTSLEGNNRLYSNSVQPDCRTETQHFRYSYFCYKSLHQIRDGDSHKGVEVKSSGGCLLGRSYPDGRMEIAGNNQMIPINLESNTPDFVASIAIALEYCYYWLTSSPFRLQDPGNGKKIDVLIRGTATATAFDVQSGYGIMTFNSEMKYDDIPLVALNGLIDLIQSIYAAPIGGITGDPQWDIPARYMIQDTLLGLNNFINLMASFTLQLGSLESSTGAAAFWAYLGLIAGDPKGLIRSKWGNFPINSNFLPDYYFNFIYSDKQKDVYNDNIVFGNFVIAVASLLLEQTPADSRFNFGSYQASLKKFHPESNTLYLYTAIATTFNCNLSDGHTMAFHILNTWGIFHNIAVNFQWDTDVNGARPLLQIMLIDASDAIVDVIRTDKCLYDRTIGLRGGTVKKIIFAVAVRRFYYSGDCKYTIKIKAIESASDVMITRWNRPAGKELIGSKNMDWDTPDIWLTSEDPKVGKDVIDVQNENDWSVVHVRLHNFGNQDAQQVRVNLFFQRGSFSPSDADWQVMKLDGLPNGLIMNVPANGTCEATAKWFCPIRHNYMDTISIAAELESPEDLSLDNNRATKNHACTNTQVEKIMPLNVDIKLTEGPIKDSRPWVVGVQFDGENILEHGVEMAQNIKVKRTVNQTQPNVAISSLNFQIDVDRIVAKRMNPAKLWNNPVRFPTSWVKPFVIKDNSVPITFSVDVDQNRKQGFTVVLPIRRKMHVPHSG